MRASRNNEPTAFAPLLLFTLAVLGAIGCSSHKESGQELSADKELSAVPRTPSQIESSSSGSPVASQDGAQCPGTLNDWDAWRDSSIRLLLRPRLSDKKEAFIDTNQVLATSVEVANFIDDCMLSYTNQAELAEHVGNLHRFVDVLRNNINVPNYDHQFGYTIDDLQYLEKVKDNVELPPLLRSPEFLKRVSDRKTYRDAYQMIVKQNASLPADQQWTVLLYKSRFLTTPDAASTFGRFFVLVPGPSYEKWIQFGIRIPGDDDSTPINNLSIVSVAKPDANGRRFNAIIDWWRTYQPDGSITLTTRRQSQGITENCVMCHKTSPLGIHPSEEYVFDSSGTLVVNTADPGRIPQKLNSLIVSYGAPYFNGWADTTAYGPPLGEDRPRSDAFMAECTSSFHLDAAAIAQVKKRMTCTDCHSDKGPGAVGLLNFPETTRTKKNAGNQIFQYLTLGWMPPNKQLSAADLEELNRMPNSGRALAFESMSAHQLTVAPLTSEQRAALYECLMQEYYDVRSQRGTFADWLRSGNSATPPPNLLSVKKQLFLEHGQLAE